MPLRQVLLVVAAALVLAARLGAQAPAQLRVTEIPTGTGSDPGSVGAVAASASGAVLVTQPGEHRLLLLRDGGSARAVGRRGSGPGEFQSIAYAGWLADTIWVVGNAQLSWVAPDGSSLRQGRFPINLQIEGGSTPLRALAGAVFAVRANGDALVTGRVREGPTLIGWVTPDGLMRNPLLSAPAVECPSSSGIRLPFCTQPLLAGAPDGRRVVSAIMTDRRRGVLRLELVATDANGAVSWRTPVDIPEVPITRRIADSVRNEIASYRGTPPELAAQVRAARMAEHFPPADQVIAARDGGVWLRIRVAPDSFGIRRFDHQGRFVGEAGLPRGVRLQFADGATAWGVRRDADDIPTVVKAVWIPR